MVKRTAKTEAYRMLPWSCTRELCKSRTSFNNYGIAQLWGSMLLLMTMLPLSKGKTPAHRLARKMADLVRGVLELWTCCTPEWPLCSVLTLWLDAYVAYFHREPKRWSVLVLYVFQFIYFTSVFISPFNWIITLNYTNMSYNNNTPI
jgi:hypothetical protein